MERIPDNFKNAEPEAVISPVDRLLAELQEAGWIRDNQIGRMFPMFETPYFKRLKTATEKADWPTTYDSLGDMTSVWDPSSGCETEGD